jgi:glycosyltransferase involved in cell wall biosynthesis
MVKEALIGVTASPVESGLGSYAYEISNVLQGNMVSLVRDKRMISATYLGEVRKSRFYPPVTSGWILNRTFPKFMFRLQDLTDTWIHYCNPMIPFNDPNKRVITFLDFLFNYDGNKSRYDLRLIDKFRTCPNVISTSRHTADQAAGYGLKQDIVTIHPSGRGFTAVPDLKRRPELMGKIIVLSVGTSIKRKNPGMIKKVMNELGERYALIRVGEPLGVRGEIVYEHATTEILNYLYNTSDVLFFPSHDEGFGYPPVEALKVGLPSVVSDIDIFHETMRNAAIFVDKDDVKSCLSGIREAVENREDIQRRQIPLREYYTPERFKREMLSFYEARTGIKLQ